MKNVTERHTQRLALALTAVLALQLVWSGARVLLKSEPDPILPAEASLRVNDIRYGDEADEALSSDLVSRPVFWRDRQPYVPSDEAADTSPAEQARGSKAIDELELHGVYTGATPGIIITFRNERRRLKLNESIEDWTFTMFSPDGAIFESGSDIRTIGLEHAMPASKTARGSRGAGRLKAAEVAKPASAADSEKQGTTNNDEKTGE